MQIDETKRHKRRKSEKLSDSERRTHCVSVRLNDAEMELLDQRRSVVRMERGEYVRCAVFSVLPEPPRLIPEINSQAYMELAKIGSNLNQIAKRLNAIETEKTNENVCAETRKVFEELKEKFLKFHW